MIDVNDKIYGCNVHFITYELGSCVVIVQNMFEIDKADTALGLQQRLHPLLLRVIGYIAGNRFYIADETLCLDCFLLKKSLVFFELTNQ